MNLQLFLGLKHLPAGDAGKAIVHRILSVHFLVASESILRFELFVANPALEGQILVVYPLMFVQLGLGIESLSAHFTTVGYFLPSRRHRNLSWMLYNDRVRSIDCLMNR